ncbi:MAG: hypothetical protein IMY71_11030 [Bacteroidetes bacterium]|nr:hypothetical protein [Bacteroidota bacterium]
MRKIILYITAVILVSQTQVRTNAQSLINDPVLLKSPVFKENFQLFTDRNIYAANEKIFFRAFNLSYPLLRATNWSEILYVEIISQTNRSVAQGKYLLNKRGTWGYIEIPETTPTGLYYIRAYTKWMRNFPPAKYFHSNITIINPNNNELQTGNDLTVTNAYSLQDYSEIQRKTIRCNTDKKIYTKRERATISISLPERNAFSPDGYCLTVVKTGALDTNMYRIRFPADKSADHPEFVNYFPETKELSLSGRIVTDKGKTPVIYARIHLALLGNNPRYFGTLIDKDGRFRFSLPYHTGVQDVFITVETSDDLPVEILIDNNFSTDFVQLSQLPSFLPPKQSELIREIMFNMQVEKIFKQPLANTIPVEKEDSSFIDFFGSPLITIKTNDYVKLPTLEEFFFELIPTVIFKKEKGRRYFRLIGNHADLAIYKPLVLLDHVPVIDVETILSLSPETIDHIDIINATYIRGYIHFGGIISIISREGDMAGIDIPRNSRLFNFKTFEPQQEIEFQDYSINTNNKRIPDFRNCLFWTPNIKMDRGEKNSFDFYTSDNQGEYVVVVHGITANGEILEGQCNFVVK